MKFDAADRLVVEWDYSDFIHLFIQNAFFHNLFELPFSLFMNYKKFPASLFNFSYFNKN